MDRGGYEARGHSTQAAPLDHGVKGRERSDLQELDGAEGMSNAWFISDTHFGHTAMLKYSPKRGARWKSAAAMDEEMVSNWNEIVKPKDAVYHCGDFWLGKYQPSEIIYRLHGEIHLVPGNHDKGLVRYCKRLFASILPQPWPWNGKFVLTHAPIHPSCLTRKERGWKLNVHGHIHERVIEWSGRMDTRYFNACVEQIDFRPVHADEIVKLGRKANLKCW